ncbi:MAG: hypothetical protein ACKVE4_10005 [Dissulfuribacterales bacterium]
MARKVTISVPDELYEKMSKWRSSFNFSKIFQKTIAGMIQSKEEFRQKIKAEFDFSAIIERLRREKLETEINYHEKGKKDALEWLKTAHYKDILYALKWVPNDEPARDKKLGDYFSQQLKKLSGLDFAEIPGQASKVSQIIHKYIDGWQQGVHEFWNTVKEEVYAK